MTFEKNLDRITKAAIQETKASVWSFDAQAATPALAICAAALRVRMNP